MDLAGCESFSLSDSPPALSCSAVPALVFSGSLSLFVEVFPNRDDAVDVFGGKLTPGVVDGPPKRDFVCVLASVLGGANLMGVVLGFQV
jgi:hypothetical protein